MANIGKKGLEVPEIYSDKDTTESSPDSQTKGLSQEQKFNLALYVIFGFGLVCLLAMLALLGSTWQFKSNSYNDYSKSIREYNDKRWNGFEKRLEMLENAKTLYESKETIPTIKPTGR